MQVSSWGNRMGDWVCHQYHTANSIYSTIERNYISDNVKYPTTTQQQQLQEDVSYIAPYKVLHQWYALSIEQSAKTYKYHSIR